MLGKMQSGFAGDALMPALSFLRLLPAWCALLFSPVLLAGGVWTNRWDQGDLLAVTPDHQLIVRMDVKPSMAVWGTLIIPIKAEQIPELNKHRKVPEFPYIDVAVEVDGYYRTAQGHIYEKELYVSTDLDVRQWEGMKRGRRLIIRLPEGSEFREALNGSENALRQVEKRYQ